MANRASPTTSRSTNNCMESSNHILPAPAEGQLLTTSSASTKTTHVYAQAKKCLVDTSLFLKESPPLSLSSKKTSAGDAVTGKSLSVTSQAPDHHFPSSVTIYSILPSLTAPQPHSPYSDEKLLEKDPKPIVENIEKLSDEGRVNFAKELLKEDPQTLLKNIEKFKLGRKGFSELIKYISSKNSSSTFIEDCASQMIVALVNARAVISKGLGDRIQRKIEELVHLLFQNDDLDIKIFDMIGKREEQLLIFRSLLKYFAETNFFKSNGITKTKFLDLISDKIDAICANHGLGCMSDEKALGIMNGLIDRVKELLK